MSGITTLPYTYAINGVISTDKTVLQNLEALCSAAGAFLNYDANQGKWAVIINKLETETVASFDNTNIVGPIQITGRGLNEHYNSVTVTFPNTDLNDEPTTLTFNTPTAELFDGEPANNLNISYDLVNDPVQASILGLMELRQSRVDKTITFATDFSQTGLRAGDLIDITNTDFGWDAKMFRIMSISDADAEDGSILLSISALEYDPAVYDFSDIFRELQTRENGITSIGAIPAPSTPTLNVVQQDVRPRITVTATVPAAIVNAMELWISPNNSTWTLVDTKETIQGAYTPGGTVSFDYDQDIPANVYVKVRALNGTSASPFSSSASYTGFSSTQVTQAANQNAPLVDTSGNLLTALALSKVAGWAFGKSPDYSTSGGVLDQLGLSVNDFTTSTGAPVNAPGFGISSQYATDTYTESQINTRAGTATLAGFAGTGSGPVLTFSFTVTYGGSSIQFQCESPYGGMDYQYIDGVTGNTYTQTNVLMYFPTLIQIKQNGTLVQEGTSDWQTQGSAYTITPSQVGGDLTGTWSVEYTIIPTYDLNMRNTSSSNKPDIFPYNFNASRGTRVFCIIYQ